MSRILFVTSSPRGAASLSTKVATALVDRLQAQSPGVVVRRDLAATPLPHIGEDFLAAQALPAEARSPAQQAALALSDTLVQELFAADTIVIASAMINFGLASTLKSWFDYLLRAGVTFRYDETGAHGLVTGKKVYLVEARGGVYSDGPAKPFDFQEPYLRHLLGFIGVTDVESIAVEGVAYGPDVAEKAVAGALDKVSTITARAA
ncbi:FMN-dependent NADH-azoreductase [Mycobacterium sp. KBS0706]|uniref:FMN-dependent NADH-azoreductase n=1 Tax=Mycobacterium sp. KBS0706 TaxID=2578109 RepID=UPI00110FD595|nr:FMN-dependent NADH-azoreductase [Mycobacterium sp. KBS0706]TSD89630.1 FMN-dependent NADH-azoreductase [Mycobacterium sp. KBS0706]